MTLSLFALDGRVALVTGGNGGLGRAIALGLQEAGAHVAVTVRDPDKNAAIATELEDAAAVFELDVRDEATVERAVNLLVERFGRLDILVNNAGTVRVDMLLPRSGRLERRHRDQSDRSIPLRQMCCRSVLCFASQYHQRKPQSAP